MTESGQVIQFLLNEIIDELSKNENNQETNDEISQDKSFVREEKISDYANTCRTNSFNTTKLSSSLRDTFSKISLTNGSSLKELQNNKTIEDDRNYLLPDSYSDSDTFDDKETESETQPIVSTPIKKNKCKSFNQFKSLLENKLGDLTYELNKNSAEEIFEEKEASEYLDKTIEEAIDKYEKEEKHFREVSVQTNHIQRFFPECSCGKRKLKNEAFKDVVFEFSNSKKIKRDKEYFFINYKNIFSTLEEPELVENKRVSGEKVDSAESTSVFNILKETRRFRLGLSKKVKPFAISI